jgi:signal peptidase I
MEKQNMEKNDQMPNKNEKYYGIGSFLLEIIKVFVLAVVIIVPIRFFLLQPFFVKGASMEPNFLDGQYLIVNELGYKKTKLSIGGNNIFTVNSYKDLQRGDVVVFRYPKDPSQFFIKRTIGLPGEKIKISNDQVTIYNKDNPSGFILDESVYLSQTTHTSGDITIQLKDDEYYLLGDNRTQSHDSRAFGPVNKDFITGKVLVRAFPFNEAKIY